MLAENHNYIDAKAFRKFLIQVGHKPLQEELLCIMRRIDLNANNRITYDEFCEAFSPIHMRVDLRNFKKHTHHSSKSPF